MFIFNILDYSMNFFTRHKKPQNNEPDLPRDGHVFFVPSSNITVEESYANPASGLPNGIKREINSSSPLLPAASEHVYDLPLPLPPRLNRPVAIDITPLRPADADSNHSRNTGGMKSETSETSIRSSTNSSETSTLNSTNSSVGKNLVSPYCVTECDSDVFLGDHMVSQNPPSNTVWSRVTHDSMRLSLPEFGVSLTIPEGALPPGSTEDVYLTVVLGSSNQPKLEGKIFSLYFHMNHSIFVS